MMISALFLAAYVSAQAPTDDGGVKIPRVVNRLPPPASTDHESDEAKRERTRLATEERIERMRAVSDESVAALRLRANQSLESAARTAAMIDLLKTMNEAQSETVRAAAVEGGRALSGQQEAWAYHSAASQASFGVASAALAQMGVVFGAGLGAANQELVRQVGLTHREIIRTGEAFAMAAMGMPAGGLGSGDPSEPSPSGNAAAPLPAGVNPVPGVAATIPVPTPLDSVRRPNAGGPPSGSAENRPPLDPRKFEKYLDALAGENATPAVRSATQVSGSVADKPVVTPSGRRERTLVEPPVGVPPSSVINTPAFRSSTRPSRVPTVVGRTDAEAVLKTSMARTPTQAQTIVPSSRVIGQQSGGLSPRGNAMIGAASLGVAALDVAHDASVAYDVQRRIKTLQPKIDEAWKRGDREVLIVARIATPKLIGVGQMVPKYVDAVFVGESGRDRETVRSQYLNRSPQFATGTIIRPQSPIELKNREEFVKKHDFQEYYFWYTAPPSTR
jgi:hypothetical protein